MAEIQTKQVAAKTIQPEQFVHLHLHSEYSLLDGALRIADIPRLAKEMGHTHVAITDHGNMFGAVAFYQACKKENIVPIIGCEVYLAPRSRFLKAKDENGAYYHLVLLCENEIGYQNLCKMVSYSYLEGFYTKPRIDLELLEKYHEGLIALSACLGGCLPSCIVKGDFGAAREHARTMQRIMGEDHYYLELQDHYIAQQADVNRGLCALSAELDIPLVATNDVHYGRRQDAEAQAVLMCIQTNHTMTEGAPIGFETEEFYYKSTEEMVRLFDAYPEAITNTSKIAARCRFDFAFDTLYLPTYPVPDGLDAGTYLEKLADEGFQRRIDNGSIDFSTHTKAEYEERIQYELAVIKTMGYAEYYLIVWDFIHYAKSQGIPVGPGRGSGAGSLVAYLVGITDVDSMKYALMFERFLNPERVSMPDFDVDFCYERRGEVIEYVARRYGADHVAQIITFGTLAARAVVRDVGRALGMPYATVDAIAKMIPRELNITLEEALRRKEFKTEYDTNDETKRLIDIAQKLEGMPRHASTHAAGVVITPRPVMEYVPLAENSGAPVTQFDMETIANLGLLKIDFLGLRYLTIISDTEKLIRKTEPEFAVERISMVDQPTYEMIAAGNTAGVFQLESAGMRRVLAQMQPDNLEGIVAAIALYRPGPMESIPKFIKNRQAPDKIVYDPPMLQSILGITYGCIVYQEQVMQICREIAGYSLGRADIVRRAMSKKKIAVMEKERAYFIHGMTDENGNVVCRGAVANGVSEETAARLFDEMAGFAKYAFNKSHAAAYAYTSYRTAYLKCHYPAQYLACLLTSVLGSTTKMAEYIADAASLGIPLLAPDINESDVLFTVSVSEGRQAIRFGLGAVKNVGDAFVQKVLAERRVRLFDSFEDFVHRMSSVELNKRQVEALIQCGAFDAMGNRRSQLLASYEQLIEKYVQQNRNNIDGQIDLFSATEEQKAPVQTKLQSYEYPDIPELSVKQRLLQERSVTGQYFSGHMLDEYADHAASLTPSSMLEIIQAFDEQENPEQPVFREKQTVTVCGILTSVKVKQTRKADSMAFLMLEDRYAAMEIVVFPAVYEKSMPFLQTDGAVAVVGELSIREDEEPKLLARSITPLYNNEVFRQKIPSQTAEAKPKKLYLRLNTMQEQDPVYQKVMNFLTIFAGQTPVVIYNGETKKYCRQTRFGFALTDFTWDHLKQLVGEDNAVLR